jgi:hypothetical protein
MSHAVSLRSRGQGGEPCHYDQAAVAGSGGPLEPSAGGAAADVTHRARPRSGGRYVDCPRKAA